MTTIILHIFTRRQNPPILKHVRPPLPEPTRDARHGEPWDFPPQRRRAATRAPPSELSTLLCPNHRTCSQIASRPLGEFGHNSSIALARFFDLLYRSPVSAVRDGLVGVRCALGDFLRLLLRAPASTYGATHEAVCEVVCGEVWRTRRRTRL